MSNTPTVAAEQLAPQAYDLARLLRTSQGMSDLPAWEFIPEHKKLHFANAAKAALAGKPVHEVWAISVGEAPTDAHDVLWRQKAPPYKLIPTAIHQLAAAVMAVTGVKVETGPADPSPDELLDDGVDTGVDEVIVEETPEPDAEE